jgi:CBS domain-containing protein
MINIKDLLAAKSADLFTAQPDDDVASALRLLETRKIGALIVMDGQKIVGIISERDCAIKVALRGRLATETRVREIMTSTVTTVDPSVTLEECMSMMNDQDIRHLPVVENGRVIGMVSIGDVSKELMKDQRHLITQLEAYVNRGFRL